MAIGDTPNQNLFGTDPMMEEQPALNAQDQILGGLGLGGAAYAAQTGQLPTATPQGSLSPFAQQVRANDAARLAAQNRPALIGTGSSTSGVTNPRLVPGTRIVPTGQPPAVTSTGGAPATTSGPTRLSADDFDFKIGGNKPKSGFKIPTAVTGLASNVVKGGVVTSLLTPNEMGRAEVFPTGAGATLFENAEGNISLVPKEGFSPMTGDNLDRREPAVTTTADENGFFSPGGFGYEYLGGRLGENIGQFAGEQKYGTGITAEGQATGFPVDRPSLAGDLLTLPGTALNLVGDFVTDPIVAGGELAKDVAGYATGATGVQAQQDAQDLGTVPALDPFTGQAIENPTPFDFNNDPSAGMTMNQQAIANALAGTNAQSQEQGQVTATPPPQTLSQFMRYEDAPEQRTEQFVDEQGRLRFRPTQEALRLQGQGAVAQPSTGPVKVPNELMSQVARPVGQTAEFRDGNRDGIEDREQGIFRPGELIGYDAQGNEVRSPGTQQPVNRIPASSQPPVAALSSFEQDSLARQQRIGGTGSFEGDSEAREARLRANERQPGESQADRDTRVAQSRTTGGQTGGLSFDDARRRAEGQLAARGVKNPSVSQVNALARGIQAGEPERLAELETQRASDEATLRQTNTKMGFEPRLIDVGGEKAMELSPGYFQRIAKDKPNKTGLQTTLDSLQDDLTSGRLTQEQYDIAVANATNLYIGLKEPKKNEIDVANEVAKLKEGAMGTTPAEGDDASDVKSFATEAEAKASGVKGEVLIGGRRAVIE